MRLGSISIRRRRDKLSPRAALAVRIVSASLLVPLLAGLYYTVDRLGDRRTLVVDEGGLIGADAVRDIKAHHGFLRLDYGIDYRVVVRDGSGDIDLFAAAQYEDLRVGANTMDGRGLLLVIDPAQDEVRLEVGYALEGVFPDAFVAYVQERQMVPFFRRDRVGDGILATTELIVDRAVKAELQADVAGEIWMTGSGGAGAATAARIGAGSAPTPPADRSDGGDGADTDAAGGTYAAAATPRATLARYFAAMDARNDDPALPIYTADTQEMLAGWTMTPAQMDQLVSTYRGCRPEATKLNASGDLAVIRYPADQRSCAPFFFRKSGDRWRLDLTMMQLAIRFGRSNAWRFVPGQAHPYAFAFADWTFDRNGFPRP